MVVIANENVQIFNYIIGIYILRRFKNIFTYIIQLFLLVLFCSSHFFIYLLNAMIIYLGINLFSYFDDISTVFGHCLTIKWSAS